MQHGTRWIGKVQWPAVQGVPTAFTSGRPACTATRQCPSPLVCLMRLRTPSTHLCPVRVVQQLLGPRLALQGADRKATRHRGAHRLSATPSTPTRTHVDGGAQGATRHTVTQGRTPGCRTSTRSHVSVTLFTHSTVHLRVKSVCQGSQRVMRTGRKGVPPFQSISLHPAPVPAPAPGPTPATQPQPLQLCPGPRPPPLVPRVPLPTMRSACAASAYRAASAGAWKATMKASPSAARDGGRSMRGQGYERTTSSMGQW